MQKLGSLLVVGLVALSGCGSDGTSPSVSAVFPTSGFLGRKVRVEIVGDATTFKDGATVDFGSGVTVDKVTVGSPTSLFADITITPTAAVGLHDVSVTSGGGKALPLSQAFDVESAISMKIDGNQAQGSVAFVTITNHDLENLFDTTNDGNPFGATFTNISITAGNGVSFNVSDVTPFAITATMTADIDAASGALSVVSGIGPDAVTSPLGSDFKIDARTPTALTSGTPTAGMMVNPYDTQLYSFTAGTAPVLAQFSAIVGPGAPDGANPRIALLPASGKFSDLIIFSASATDPALETGGQYYAVILDNTGTAGYNYTLRATGSAITKATETANNNTVANAQAVTLPAWLDAATLSDLNDQDWMKFTAAGAAGKKLHIVTLPGDPQTDTIVDVFSGTGTTSVGESSDLDYHEDFLTTALPAGTIWVEVSASQAGFFDPAMNHYKAVMWLE